MLIKKRRIRTLKPYQSLLRKHGHILVGTVSPDEFGEKLKMAGFAANPQPGDTVLPSADSGPVSQYNAEGRYIPHKDEPMETVYRQAEWSWTEWDGTEHTKIVDIPYQRYPRSFDPPPSIELQFIVLPDGTSAVLSPSIETAEASERRLIHVVNLFLEIFGECQFFTKELEQVIKVPLRRLNWNVLPPGQRPWPHLRSGLDHVIKHAPDGNQAVLEYRLAAINAYKPEFAAVGQAGFSGYVVLGFPSHNLFILESLYYGNATYVLDSRWEELSQLSKAEILNSNLEKDRLIHREGWADRLEAVIEQAAVEPETVTSP